MKNSKDFDCCIFCKGIMKYFYQNTNYDTSLYDDVYQECVLKCLELVKEDKYVNKFFMINNLKYYINKNFMTSAPVSNLLSERAEEIEETEDIEIENRHFYNMTFLDFCVLSTYKQVKYKSYQKTSDRLGVPVNIVKNIVKFYKGLDNVRF